MNDIASCVNDCEYKGLEIETKSVSEAVSSFNMFLLHGTISYTPPELHEIDQLAMKNPVIWSEKIRYCLYENPDIISFPIFKGQDNNYWWSGVGLIIKEGTIIYSGLSSISEKNKRKPFCPIHPYQYTLEEIAQIEDSGNIIFELAVADAEFEAVYYNPKQIRQNKFDKINNSLTLYEVIVFSKKIGMPVHLINDEGVVSSKIG